MRFPGLHAKLDQAASGKRIPDFLVRTIILGVHLSQWLLLLVFVPLSWGAAKLIVWIVTALSRRAHSYWAPCRIWGQGKAQPSVHLRAGNSDPPHPDQLAGDAAAKPLLLQPGVLDPAGVHSGLAVVAPGSANRRHRRSPIHGNRWAAGSSAVLLGRRVFDAILIILVALLSLNILGFDTRTALTGLGIGGIALALGMQKTLENFLGGVTLLSDGMLRIGDQYKLGERVGTVEDVRLRSTTFRMNEGTALTIPNGVLAVKEIETLIRKEQDADAVCHPVKPGNHCRSASGRARRDRENSRRTGTS